MKNEDFRIIVDTREQQPWSFEDYSTSIAKLDTGDYSIEGLEDTICIERKKSVSEVANNITESRFKDVINRLKEIKYPFVLLEFDLYDVLRYPVGSNVPKRMWSKIRISPAFIMKNILDLELKHNIHVIFCGDEVNASKLAGMIFKRMYYHISKESTND
jgi:ERCC4-type nuclease